MNRRLRVLHQQFIRCRRNFHIFSDPRATAPTRFKIRPSDHPMVGLPRSLVASMVRPTLSFFHRRFIRRYTDALVPPVIMVRRDGIPYLNLIEPPPLEAVHHRLSSRRLRRSSTSTCVPRSLHRPYVLVTGRLRLSSTRFTHARAAIADLGFGPPRQIRPCAATRARWHSQGGAQGPVLPPQPLLVAIRALW
jgi:hypothetical protein